MADSQAVVTDRLIDGGIVQRLHRKANAARWGLTPDRFSAVLQESVSHALPTGSTPAAVDRYAASLHLEDLALAAACADGNEAAWEHFIREHRPILYRAADAMDKTGAAREAADALYGELFGVNVRDGQRRSLFRYFHGRSSLATWLRAILAQRHVDALRRSRRLEPLPTEEERGSEPVTTVRSGSPEREQFVEVMRQALKAAVKRLEARDHLRLACYYAQNLTLAQIGRLLREHEATASRQLARTRRAVRENVEDQLRRAGMSEAAITECFASVVDDAGTLDLAEILPGKNAGRDRST